VKPLLVGEMPSRAGDRYYKDPLSGAVAQSLCQLAGIAPHPEGTRYGRWTLALYERFDTVNAIERHGPWDSRLAAKHLADKIDSDCEVVVLLGRRAQSAYVRMYEPATTPLAKLGYFTWRVDMVAPTARREVVVIHHPAKNARMYEHSAPREKAGKILREAIDKASALYETRL
jgi:hypothetical protein